MLAPRKTLWSTPDTVVETAWSWIDDLNLQGKQICDIGCGDGRVLLQWAECYSSTLQKNNSSFNPPSFLGMDVDRDRIQQAQRACERARAEGRIDASVQIQFICQNAMEHVNEWSGADVLYFYLIPRGLRQVRAHLLGNQQKSQYVITYMAPLSPDDVPLRRENIPVPHQPGAAWPLYLYHLSLES